MSIATESQVSHIAKQPLHWLSNDTTEYRYIISVACRTPGTYDQHSFYCT